MLHVHVLFVSPLRASNMAKPSADQHEGGVAVGEATDTSCAAADLPVEPLDDIVGVNYTIKCNTLGK